MPNNRCRMPMYIRKMKPEAKVPKMLPSAFQAPSVPTVAPVACRSLRLNLTICGWIRDRKKPIGKNTSRLKTEVDIQSGQSSSMKRGPIQSDTKRQDAVITPASINNMRWTGARRGGRLKRHRRSCQA